MSLEDFGDRAEECMELARRAGSQHDRDLLIEMARAWYGMAEKPAQISRPRPPFERKDSHGSQVLARRL
jgi:hypothetical protein